MEIIWHILLTVCLKSECVSQDIQWFDTKEECLKMLPVYTDLPQDGNWDSVLYICKPKDSIAS